MKHDQVFIDSSMFKAVIDENDDFYERGSLLWSNLQEKQLTFVTSNFILDESYTLIRTRCGLRKVFEFRDKFFTEGEQIIVERVTANDEAEAWNWFEKDWKGLSFTDCVCFAMMSRLQIQTAATFDTHFKKAGFACIP